MIIPYRLGVIHFLCRIIAKDAKKLIRCLAELPVLLAAVATGDGSPGFRQPQRLSWRLIPVARHSTGKTTLELGRIPVNCHRSGRRIVRIPLFNPDNQVGDDSHMRLFS